MTKKELLNSAKNIEKAAMELLKRTSALRTDTGSALQAAKRLESQLQSKEREAQLERERAEAEAKSELERAMREASAEQEKAAEREKSRLEEQSASAVCGSEKDIQKCERREDSSEPEIKPAEKPCCPKASEEDVQKPETQNERRTPIASETEKKNEKKTPKKTSDAASLSKGRSDIPDTRSQEHENRSHAENGKRREFRAGTEIESKQYGKRGAYENEKRSDRSSDKRKPESKDDIRSSKGKTNSDIRDKDGRGRTQSPHYQQRKQESAGGGRESRAQENKGTYVRTFDIEKKGKNKKTIMKETAPSSRNWDDEGRNYGARRRKPVKAAEQRKPEPVIIEKAIITTELITVRDFSEKIGKPAAEIIKKLFMMGIVANINQEIDFDTCQLVAMDYEIEIEQQLAKSFEETMQASAEEADTEEQLVPRPPVVTIMGHVDHGKTSLLDAIRNSSVTSGEAGGITQHIGAYTVKCNDRMITFIDTPGHEAFTAMRARGAQVTDVVILVVAADDGIMPQTVEAINHSKAANVPIIVAINKIDKPEADPDRVKKQLTEYGLVCEEWGGDVICVPISAKKQLNLDNLLEMVLLQADILELRANPDRAAKGTIIESKLDKGRGPVATVLVQNGTLKVGDPIVAGTVYGKVRAMTDDRGRFVKSAGPSQPVEVLGFNEVPEAGDIMNVAEVSKKVAEERRTKQKVEQMKNLSKASLEDLFAGAAEGEIKTLNLIIKADVHGSVEAVTQALEKLSNDEVHIKCIHGGVGGINESDIMFASASNAIVIGFNVRPDSGARALAEQEKVDIRTYRVIYQAIEDVENAMKGMFKPVYREVQLGTVSVRSIFKISGVGVIAGCYVQEGKVERNSLVRLVRDGIVIHEGKIASLRRFKDDVKEVAAGYECGIGIENFNDIAESDIIEAYIMEEVKR